tara:strand:- start:141 stop:542 length:402 start_codon:yes stop_codon:yes gene_type:complete
MNLTKVLLKRIRSKIQGELNKVAEELNVTLTLGNCSFSSGRAKFQLELLTEGGKSKEQEDLENMAQYLNLDLDKIAEQSNEPYKLWGFKSRARKNPYIIENTRTNQKYVISESHAVRLFQKEKPKVGELTLVQ